MVVGVGYLDEPGAGQLRAKALGHRAREDRAPLSADHERRCGDSREERPAVDRHARRVARRIEPRLTAPSRHATLSRARWASRAGSASVSGGRSRKVATAASTVGCRRGGRTPRSFIWASRSARNRRARVHDDQPPDPIGVPRGAGDRVVAAHRVPDEDRRAPTRGGRSPRRCRPRSPRSRTPAAAPTRSPRGRAGRAPRRGGAPRAQWRPRRTSARGRPPRGAAGRRTGPPGPTRAGGGPRPRTSTRRLRAVSQAKAPLTAVHVTPRARTVRSPSRARARGQSAPSESCSSVALTNWSSRPLRWSHYPRSTIRVSRDGA